MIINLDITHIQVDGTALIQHNISGVSANGCQVSCAPLSAILIRQDLTNQLHKPNSYFGVKLK